MNGGRRKATVNLCLLTALSGITFRLRDKNVPFTECGEILQMMANNTYSSPLWYKSELTVEKKESLIVVLGGMGLFQNKSGVEVEFAC